MKFTLSWLKAHLDTGADVDTISEKLTALGLEVEEVTDRSKGLEAFKVAYVVSAEKHPDADKLRVCMVDTGSGTVQVVCGAPNARTGMKGVFAPDRHDHPGNRRRAEEGRHPGRRVERHALLRAGDGPVGRAQRHHRSARGRSRRRPLRIGAGPRRSADRHLPDAGPGGLRRRARHRPRPVGRRPWAVEAARHHAGAGPVHQPDRRYPRLPGRPGRGLPDVRRPADPGRARTVPARAGFRTGCCRSACGRFRRWSISPIC